MKTINELRLLRLDSEDHTLKYFDSGTKGDDKAVIFIDDLRKSAIEDIQNKKEIFKEFDKFRSYTVSKYHKFEDIMAEFIQWYIQNKFNITDEDLK